MGIQINGNTDTITAIDGALTVSGAELSAVTNLNATGIVTASSFSGPLIGNVNGNVNSSGVSTVTTLRATSIVGVTTAGITTAYIGSVNDGPLSGARNRIINGDMRIDQRFAGVSTTPTSNIYTLDRWLAITSASSKYSVQRNAGSVTPPVGFTNYLGTTSLSAYSSVSSDFFLLNHYIEGLNSADLAFGTSSASPITLSFWVRSSLTGTFSVSICNNPANRNYISTYLVNNANTWEYKTITIPGDTAGTWDTGISVGIQVRFDLGSGSNYNGTAGSWITSNLLRTSGSQSLVGTNGATFYLTGVQLEAGTVATPFERRSYAQELALCERYCQRYDGGRIAIGNWASATVAYVTTFLRNAMRSTPTIFSYTAGNVLVESVNWYAATTVVILESSSYTASFTISGISNSGQSVNANAVWGNGAAVVIQSEL